MTASHRPDAAYTSHDFVRVLRSACDPPTSGGPSKIEIAQEAWDNPSFYVPSKAEVIADWILTRILKDKGKEISQNPVFDVHHWQLLLSLLGHQHAASNVQNITPRTENAWLLPLLQRVPLGPIVVAFLASFHESDEAHRQDLAKAVSSCLKILWPAAVQKFTTEVLQECFGALLLTQSYGTGHHALVEIGRMICNSYRNSLNNSSSKKKLYQMFANSYLEGWINCIQNVLDEPLRKDILDAGVDTLFNLDVLRQNVDIKGEGLLLDRLQALLSGDGQPVLKALPILFMSYFDTLKKNRGALFGQGSHSQTGSSLSELHNHALRSFIAFSSLLDNLDQNFLVWSTRQALLQIIARENIFSHNHVEARMALEHVVELSLVCLGDGWKEDSTCSVVAVSCLSAIARIDYDLILPSVPRILPLLLRFEGVSPLYIEFLDLLLDYHVKTRTLGTFVETLLFAIRDCDFGSMDITRRYHVSFSSPIMHQEFLDKLSKAVQKFLTESQNQATTALSVDALSQLWDSIYSRAQGDDSALSEAPKKKRKADRTENPDIVQSAITYSLVCRLASVVLHSLPIQSLSEDTSKTVRNSIIDFRTEFINRAILKATKSLKKGSESVAWPAEISLAATLRLLYALNVSRTLRLPVQYDEKAAGRMTELLNNDDLLPELRIELFRTLFYHLSSKQPVDKDRVLHHFLRSIQMDHATADIRWSGQTHLLSKSDSGRAKSSLALLHLVIERWLPEVDRLASSEQIKDFLRIVLSIEVQSGAWSEQEIDPGNLLMRLLHSAQFWEMKNIRTVFLSLLDETTAQLSSDSNSSTLRKQLYVYRHLLLFPMEYFSWPLLNDLARRCMIADTALEVSKESEAVDDLTVLRIFLKRVFSYANTISQDMSVESPEFLIHLTTPAMAIEEDTPFVRATLTLVETYLLRLLKSCKKNGPQAISEVLASLKPQAFSSRLDISALPEEVVVAVTKLHHDMQTSLTPLLKSISETRLSTSDHVKSCLSIVSGWNTVLCLQRWLMQIDNSVSNLNIFGKTLTRNLTLWLKRATNEPSPECQKLSVDVFTILLQELEMLPATDHEEHLDSIISVYLLLSEFLNAEARRNMGLHLARTCRKLAVSDYVYTLSFISDALSKIGHFPMHYLPHLVDLAALVLREHPTHTLLHIQKFATACLNIFSNQPVFFNAHPGLRLRVLDMISVHCANQHTALRSADTAAIWSLLSKYLAPSVAHEDETDVAAFRKIVAIVSSLVRLRRDLVSHTLPHLGVILRQLIFCLRACRPNLGGKQTTLVMSSLPRWINFRHPLGAEEARALGRLLESLTTKTIVRVLGSSYTETQKAESMAKPFSKHAAYVLQAYIESMNDPLCVLSLEIRKEIEAGLFALCSMISEHSRDALMISALDAGGKAILKALWKEYEKQRYVGKG